MGAPRPIGQAPSIQPAPGDDYSLRTYDNVRPNDPRWQQYLYVATVNGYVFVVNPAQSTQPQETVTLTINPAGAMYDDSNGNFVPVPVSYTAGFASTATFTILSYTVPSLSFSQSATTINPGNSATFTATRAGDVSAAMTVRYSVSGTATNGTDYNYLDGDLVIPVGQTSASVTIVVPQRSGGTAVSSESIVITPQPSSTSPASYEVVAGQQPLTYTIPPYTPSTLTIATADPTLTPGEAGQFTITRTGGDISQALPVNFNLSGTATNGTDYSLPQAVTIPAGQTSATYSFATTPQNGATATPQRSLNVGLAAGEYAVGTNNAIAYTITAYSPSTVDVAASGGGIVNRGTTGGFTVTRTGGDASQALPVNYSWSGTAQNGSDYAGSTSGGSTSGVAVIPAGQLSVVVPVSVPAASGVSDLPSRTITFTIGAGSRYTLGSAAATLTIPAYTSPRASIAASDLSLNPGEQGSFTLTRSSGDISQPLDVSYTTAGTAQSGTDYTALPGFARIPANQTSVNVSFSATAQNGATASSQKTLDVSLSEGAYTLGSAAAIQYTISAYNPNGLTITPSNGGTVNRGSTGNFVVTRAGGDTSQPLTINYSLGGAATNGSDYTAPTTGTLTLPAGQISGSIPVNVPAANGATALPAEDIVVTIQPGNGYSVPTSPNNQSSLTIPAYTPNGLTVTPSGNGTILSGTSGGFTVTRSGATTAPLSVDYTLGGSAANGTDYTAPTSGVVTIPAGQTSATVPVTVPSRNGSTAIPQKNISFTVQPGSGYDTSNNPASALSIPAYNPNGLTITPSGGGGIQPGTTGSFTITRTGDTSQSLPVNYQLGGTATPNEDYETLGGQSGTITIPPGQTSVSLPIRIPANVGTTSEPSETITFSVQPGNGYDASAAQPGTLTIPATAGVNAIALGTDVSHNPASFQISRPVGSDTSQSVTIPYTTGGSGVAGVDYVALPGQVTIPAGQTSATIPVQILPTAQAGRDIALNFQPPAGYTMSSNNPTFSIAAGDIPEATVVPNPIKVVTATTSTNPPTVTLTRPAGSDTSQALVIPYLVGGTAIADEDYIALSGVATIPAGEMSVSVPLTILSTAQAGRTVVLDFQPPDGVVVNPDPWTYTIAGSDIPVNQTSTPTPTPTPTPVLTPTPSPTPRPRPTPTPVPRETNSSGSSSSSGGSGAGAAISGTAALGGLTALVAGGGVGDVCPVAQSILPDSVMALARQAASSSTSPISTTEEMDWSKITFATLPMVNNQPADQALRLNQFDALGDRSLGEIREMAGLDGSTNTLFTSGLVEDTTLKGLFTSVYTNRETIGDVEGLAEFLVQQSQLATRQLQAELDATAIAQMPLADFLAQNPSYASINLGNVALSDIPGLMEVPLKELPGWDSLSVARIPGLSQIAFSELFPCLLNSERNLDNGEPHESGSEAGSRSGDGSSGSGDGGNGAR